MNLVDAAALIKILNEHGCYMTTEDEEAIVNRAWDLNDSVVDAADLALRHCMCGERIDGFDEYASHLLGVIGRLSSTT